jgi:hypothetical protein
MRRKQLSRRNEPPQLWKRFVLCGSGIAVGALATFFLLYPSGQDDFERDVLRPILCWLGVVASAYLLAVGLFAKRAKVDKTLHELSDGL